MEQVQIQLGDARALTMPDNSVDAIVCDPPYELSFMGKGWDASGVAYDVDMWRGCYRVLKPGGYLLAFGGTRTSHRMVAAIEDAGFEIRDSITWLYGSGFPKSLDVSKAIDKAAGAVREVVGSKLGLPGYRAGDQIASTVLQGGGASGALNNGTAKIEITAPATDEARQWAGWGTALKPASEPITVARKPFRGNVAGNVLAHGTGAINIDACRVPGEAQPFGNGTRRTAGIMGESEPRGRWEPTSPGRWPANVVLSHVRAWDGADACGGADGCMPGCPVAALDEQSGVSTGVKSARGGVNSNRVYGAFAEPCGYADTGGASRFFATFRYQAKAPTRERPRVDGVQHPTVKPLTLMRWLVRLVTPPGGTVLDPFAGSGTTVEAAVLEGFNAIGVESHEPYLALIAERLARHTEEVGL